MTLKENIKVVTGLILDYAPKTSKSSNAFKANTSFDSLGGISNIVTAVQSDLSVNIYCVTNKGSGIMALRKSKATTTSARSTWVSYNIPLR